MSTTLAEKLAEIDAKAATDKAALLVNAKPDLIKNLKEAKAIFEALSADKQAEILEEEEIQELLATFNAGGKSKGKRKRGKMPEDEAVLAFLGTGERQTGKIAKHFGVTPGPIGKRLNDLKSKGKVKQRQGKGPEKLWSKASSR